MSLTMKINVFWDAMPRIVFGIYGCFIRACCLLCLGYSSTLRVEAECSLDMSVNDVRSQETIIFFLQAVHLSYKIWWSSCNY